eukprot:TRINITY_DN55604_c0_g1_i1.p1 TRINITY_DN55604_c0_g1~~TRINITY_DN55604_c0_g1_i1.p1  ORF type:complete len:357 (-),score=49.22 TRINITY_DN55604_c0_g1_i1:83-1153(-)
MSTTQEVRRKLDLSLEDLVKEDKGQGAKRRRGSQGSGGSVGRQRTSTGNSSFGELAGVSPSPVFGGKSDGKGDKPYKKRLCIEFEKGTCKKDGACTYAHGVEELRRFSGGSDSVAALPQDGSKDSGTARNRAGSGEGGGLESTAIVPHVVAPPPLQPYPPPGNPYGPPAQPPLRFGPWGAPQGYYGMPAYGYWPQPPPPIYHYGLPPPQVSPLPDVHADPMKRPPGDCSRPPVAPQASVRPRQPRQQKEASRPTNSNGGHGARVVPPPQPGHQVKLCNIPPDLTARDLAEAFGKISQSRVESVEVLRDSTGAPTLEAYVVFNSLADAQHAVRRYHGGDLNGRQLRVLYEGEVNLQK